MYIQVENQNLDWHPKTVFNPKNIFSWDKLGFNAKQKLKAYFMNLSGAEQPFLRGFSLR